MSSPTVMRAYYRHATGDFSSPQDSGRPVSEEELRALGVKWWEIDGSHEERMKEYRELSKNLGFTDDGYEHLYDLRNPGGGMPHNTDMTPKDMLQSWTEDTLFPHDAFALYIAGELYVDLKEPGTDSEYIRLLIPPRYAFFYPAGTLFQGYNPADKHLASATHCLHKSNEGAESVMALGENLDKHPARVEYVKRILGEN